MESPPFTIHSLPAGTQQNYISLMQAIRNNDEVLVQKLVDKNAPVNRYLPDTSSLTPLHLAIQSRSSKIVKILLDKGADVNARSFDHSTPLILAAKTGDLSLIDLLLSSDVLNYTDYNDSLSHLHIACMRNRVDLLKKLLLLDTMRKMNESVKVNSMFWPGFSPLHFAVYFGCVEVVEFLLKCGADMMCKDARGATPLHLADLQRNERIIDLLLSAHEYQFKNPVGPDGITHFHIACTRDNASIVAHFLRSGADINLAIDNNKRFSRWCHWKPVDFAIYYGCPEVIKLLLNAGVDPRDAHDLQRLLKYAFMTKDYAVYDLFIAGSTELSRPYCDSWEKMSVLNIACIKDDVQLIEQLMNESEVNDSLDLNQSIWTGHTPLHLAVACKSTNVTKFLLDHGADIMIQDAKNRTPLHTAFYNDASKLLELMAEKLSGEAQNLVDDEGLSLFHIVCTIRVSDWESNLVKDLVQSFLHHGVEISSQVWDVSELWAGFTPLHFACKYRQHDVVELLLAHHADVLITNTIGLNPFDLLMRQMAVDNSVHYYSYCLIMRSILLSVSTEIHGIISQKISILHTFCFEHHLSPEEWTLLQKCLVSHRNQINSIIQFHINHEYNGSTPLHIAMRHGYVGDTRLAVMMLENGADPLIADSKGRTALEYAHDWNRKDGYYYERPTKFFTLERINLISRPSHFHVACGLGLVDVVKCALDNVDEETKEKFVNFLDDKGRSPLHHLLQRKYLVRLPSKQITRLLLENGANPNFRDYLSFTLLQYTYRDCDLEETRLLINHGADPNIPDIYGGSPLIDFWRAKNADGIVLLLENGADVNVMNREGRTCLMEMLDDFSYTVRHYEPPYYKNSITAILKHIKRLQSIGSYLRQENIHAYSGLLQQVNHVFDEVTFANECEKELELMKTVRIDKYTTLRDILSENLNSMAIRCVNSNLQTLIETDDFYTKYPIYGYLVKLQMKYGAARRPLLLESEKALMVLCGPSKIPRVCIGMILRDLDDTDLRNIISSVQESESS